MKIDKNKIHYRKATISDIDCIIDYRVIFLKETYGDPGPEKEVHLRNTLRTYLKKAFENDTFVSFIAEYENKAIGFSGMVIREQPGTFDIPSGKTAYILNMFTLKEFRKNGICNQLFTNLIDEARERKLDRIDLHATKEGEPIYRQYGFAEPHDVVLEKII